MKAITLAKAGGVENLVIKELPVPTIKDNEVLVRVKAISVNPVDAFVRGNEGALKAILQLKEGEQPIIIGWDISGEVVATGNAVTQFNKGDEVFGMVNFAGHGKAYAEYVAASESHLALKPANTSHEEAAAATLAALTAWQSLVQYAKIKAGDKVLIHSAAGGVGHYAVQIAKHFGAYVIGTSSAAKKDYVLSLGADKHIDYTQQRFETVVTDADIVLDAVGEPGHLDRSLDALKPGGRIISLLIHFDDNFNAKAKTKEVYAKRLSVVSNGAQMADIAALLEKGDLHSHVSHTFNFDEMPLAHQQVATGKTQGKIVVVV
ncbi:NADPH:quinone reductase-like Zn-dependent oxidoreductase [Chitinophaga niastensis]|uniref:NADPH:quinone reductase-like Zn-dependent oxidoreductase n=1 Tax=Chitinophaga niastensis TaxID=536980 RepID=A0A2P8HK09_CHINA|nr:NADP-dependent oxidoreductase [Chitinophaga niastensis]PSL46557.1 NADPH:quinone reductase-like Zn-dependent oxidoreductase [Chitinophaga niastensis]